MTRFQLNRPIVVGVDGSDLSLTALEWAARYAKQCKCPLRVVYVAQHRPSGSATVRAQVNARLGDTLPRPGWVIWRLRFGHPAELLVQEAVGARLLVLGHRQPRPLIGSTLRRVLARGVGHVAVVTAGWSAELPTSGTIVVGVRDLTSRPAVELAFEFAAIHTASVTVVHATPRPHPTDDRTIADETHRIDAAAQAMLETLLSDVRREYSDIPVDLQVVQGEPAQVLDHAAATADLLVIGGRAPSGTALRGSTVEDILKISRRPVIVAHTVRQQAPRTRRLRLRQRVHARGSAHGTATTRPDRVTSPGERA